MYYGAKIYYQVLTGQVLQVVPPTAGEFVVPNTKEEDFKLYATLKGRIPGTVGVLQLDYPYGKYAEEFSSMVPAKVDIYTGNILFTRQPDEPSSPVITPVSDRLDQAEFALMDTLMETVRVGLLQHLAGFRADGVDNALVDLVLQHTTLQLAFDELKSEVDMYRDITAALLMEVTILKGGGEVG
jgi:hypothetical protein